jgi:TRAP transporter T-component
MHKALLSFSVIASLSFGTGCIKSTLTNGQISATREAAGSFETIGDYDLAKSAAMAGMVQFEGMHKLAPDNEDALFMLMQGWTGYGYAFAEDDREAAMDAGDDDLADYHRKRARMAYDRAIFYGVELLSHTDKGWNEARRNDALFKAWLKENFNDKEDAETLLWLGNAWLARVQLNADEPALVAELFIGIALLEQSLRLDPTIQHYSAMTNLGAYHSRTVEAEPVLAKQMFDTALAKTNHKSLIVQVAYAKGYACVRAERPLYEKLLNEVLAADDPDPDQRLTNAVAKRRAKRYLGKKTMMDCGFDMSPPASAPAPAVAPAPAPAAAPKK